MLALGEVSPVAEMRKGYFGGFRRSNKEYTSVNLWRLHLKIAEPTLTIVAPSSTATSKSFDIPIDSTPK